MTTDTITQLRELLAVVGPMVENPVLTDGPEPRVEFDSLHLGDEGPKEHHWDLSVPEALMLLTGLVDGANYVMSLQLMAAERDRLGLN